MFFGGCEKDDLPIAPVTFDGYTYSTIKIGKQIWFAENLRTTTYANGDLIPNIKDSYMWNDLTTGAWVHHKNDIQNENTYGKLYNWFAVADKRNCCPVGWHVPTDAEYTKMINYLGGDSVAGGKMKSTGTTYWESPNTDATNVSGFSGLPGGFRYAWLNSSSDVAPFSGIGTLGYWWTSTKNLSPSNSAPLAYKRVIDYGSGSVIRQSDWAGMGMSVRCLRD